MTGPDIPSGCLDGKVHRFAVRVYYEDTDLSGVVYHANYLRWFERARSDLLRLIGIDQRRAHEAGEGAFAVADMALRYASPARLDDGVVVETRLAALNGASCTLLQQAFRQKSFFAPRASASPLSRQGTAAPSAARVARCLCRPD
jgi:acyl-CoA thioester hydrolase